MAICGSSSIALRMACRIVELGEPLEASLTKRPLAPLGAYGAIPEEDASHATVSKPLEIPQLCTSYWSQPKISSHLPDAKGFVETNKGKDIDCKEPRTGERCN